MKKINIFYFICLLLICVTITACTTNSDKTNSDKTNCPPLTTTTDFRYTGDYVSRTFPYIINGNKDSIEIILSKQLRDYMSCRSDEFLNQSNQMQIVGLGTWNYFSKELNESEKYSVVKSLADAIKLKSSDPEMQVRIATSVVQQIPVDCVDNNVVLNSKNSTVKKTHISSPYEVLYDQNGICSEKTMLLTLLIENLGYGSAFLIFDNIQHTVTGIKGNGNDQYRNTGYILLETMNNVPPGYSFIIEGPEKTNVSDPIIIPLSQGAEFHLSDQDRIDRQNIIRVLQNFVREKNFSTEEANQMRNFIKRYGMSQICNLSVF